MTLEYQPIKNEREIIKKTDCYVNAILAFKEVLKRLEIENISNEDDYSLHFVIGEEKYTILVDLEEADIESMNNEFKKVVVIFYRNGYEKNQSIWQYWDTTTPRKIEAEGGVFSVIDHEKLTELIKYTIRKLTSNKDKLPFK